MFNDIDDKLKSWAKATFWILTLGFIALAIITGWQDEAYISYTGRAVHDSVFHAEFFFGFLIGGPIDAYIVSALIYGIGEIISNQYEIQNILAKNGTGASTDTASVPPVIGFQKSAEKIDSKKTMEVRSDIASPAQDKRTNTKHEKSHGKTVPVKVTIGEDGMLVCPDCGLKQEGTRQVCFECGQVFINKQNVPYWCGNCGKAGPFDDVCPNCGSTEKIINE